MEDIVPVQESLFDECEKPNANISYSEKTYLNFFQDILHSKEEFKTVKFSLKENKSKYSTIEISLEPTVYRQNKCNLFFVRIKVDGDKKYISFKLKYMDWFTDRNIPYTKIKSDLDFFRVDLYEFQKIINEPEKYQINELVEDMFFSAVNFDAFGCCSKYMECSNEGKCLHSDVLYSKVCMYRKNLEKGMVFYGNKE